MKHKTLAEALAMSLAKTQNKKQKRPDVVKLLREDARKRRRAQAELEDEAKEDEPREDFTKSKEDSPDRLRVLVDPDAQKISMKVFEGYVSEERYERLVEFLKEFDAMLYKFRDGRPLEREEIEKIEDDYKDSDSNGTDDAQEEAGNGEGELMTSPGSDMPGDDGPIDATDPDEEEDPEPAYVISELDDQPKSPLHNVLVNKFGLAEATDGYQHSENHHQWEYVSTEDSSGETELPVLLAKQDFKRANVEEGQVRASASGVKVHCYQKPNQEVKLHVKAGKLLRLEHRVTNPGPTKTTAVSGQAPADAGPHHTVFTEQLGMELKRRVDGPGGKSDVWLYSKRGNVLSFKEFSGLAGKLGYKYDGEHDSSPAGVEHLFIKSNAGLKMIVLVNDEGFVRIVKNEMAKRATAARYRKPDSNAIAASLVTHMTRRSQIRHNRRR